AHQWYGYILRAEGRQEEGIAQMRLALQLDPLTLNKQQSLGASLSAAGHDDEALELFRKIPDGDANTRRRHRWMAAIYERQGMQREAIAEQLKELNYVGKSELASAVEHEYLASGYAKAEKLVLSEDLKAVQINPTGVDSDSPSVDAAGDSALLGDT